MKVWTVLDGDEGDLVLVSGWHYVNRFGYIICDEPVPDMVVIEVNDD